MGPGNRKAALTYFGMADEYPENHQLARNPGNPRNAQIYYDQPPCFAIYVLQFAK